MKLLMLGTTGRGTKELLLEAKRRGIYTIVTDNLSVGKAPLKLLADEYWMISTADIAAIKIFHSSGELKMLPPDEEPEEEEEAEDELPPPLPPPLTKV